MIATKGYVDVDDLADSISLHAGCCRFVFHCCDSWTGYHGSWSWVSVGMDATLRESDGEIELDVYEGDGPTRIFHILHPPLADADAVGRMLGGRR